MSFIAGYVGTNPSSASRGISNRLTSFEIVSEAPLEPYTHSAVSIPGGVFVSKYLASHPLPPRLVKDAGGNALALLGFTLTSGSVGEPEELLACAVAEGMQALTRVEGEFLLAFAHAATGVVHLVNDRFASRPCYVLRVIDGLYFSSSLVFLAGLAGQGCSPDPVGWMEAMVVGHTIGSRTTVSGIERLSPGTHLSVEGNLVETKRYWSLQHRPNLDLDPSRFAGEVFAAFQKGVARRANLVGKGLLALSGGLDSRLLAACLPQHTDFEAFTFTDSVNAADSREATVAAAVARALELPHHCEMLHGRPANPRDVLMLTGGMRPYQHMAFAMPYVNRLKATGRNFLLGGGPGDVLAGSYIPSRRYLDPMSTAECLRDAFNRRIERSKYWNYLFSDDVIRESRAPVEDALEASLAEVGGPTAAHRITAWAMVYRQPAFTFTTVFHTHPEVGEAFGHLDYEYTDLMLSLPAEWLYDKSFYAFMIYSQIPGLRHVPYANTGSLLSGRAPSLRKTRSTFWRDMQRMPVRYWRSILIRLGFHQTKAAMPAVLGDPSLQETVREILHSAPILRPMLNIERCDDFLDGIGDGRFASGDHQEVFGVLASMCLSVATVTDDTSTDLGRSDVREIAV